MLNSPFKSVRRYLPLVALFLAPATFAAYELSDDFDLEATSPSSPTGYIRLSDTEALAYGPFDLLDGELVGSAVILKSDGSFTPLSLSQPFLRATVTQAVKNTDGSYGIVVTDHAIPGVESYANTLLDYSANGELLRAIEIPWGPKLLPNHQLLDFVNETIRDGETFRWSTQPRRLNLANTGEVTADPTFTATAIDGTASDIVALADGSVILIGEFPNAATLAISQLLKFTSTGSLAPGFNRDGFSRATLDYPSPLVTAMPGGDLFLFSESASRSPIHIKADGTFDNTFQLPANLGIYYTTQITPTGNGQYYLTSPFIQLDQSYVTAVRINANGSLDTTFIFDRNDYFEEGYGSSSAFPFANGTVLTSGRQKGGPDHNGSFALLGLDGTATPANPGQLERLLSPNASWLPTGELLLDNGIARADGSARVIFPNSVPAYLIPLQDGTFATPDFKFYDENAQAIPGPTVPPFTTLIAQLPDKGWLVELRNRQNYPATGIGKLHPDGTLDTTFTPLNPSSHIYQIDAQYIYYGYQTTGPNNQILRVSLNGKPDTSFSIQDPDGRFFQMFVLGNHIYVPQLRTHLHGVDKPLGARFDLSGNLDSSYAPETTLRQSNLDYTPTRSIYAADGSSFQFALAQSDSSATGFQNLWQLSPDGTPTLIDDTKWKEASLSVSPQGDLLVSGKAQTPVGELSVAARYKKQAVAFSTPRLEIVAYSTTPTSLDVNLLDAPNAQLAWTKNGQPIPGASSASLAFDSLDSTEAGEYTLTATLSGQAYTFGPIRLIPPTSPSIVSQPQNLSAALASSAQLRGQATSLPYPDLQWFRDGFPIEGATSPTLPLEAIGFEDLGTYRLRASNPLGSSWSQPAVLSLTGILPAGTHEFEITADISLGIEHLIPKPDGGYWIHYLARDQNFGITTHHYDRYDADGTITFDWGKDFSLGDFDTISVDEFSGHVFAYWSEYSNGGQNLQTTFIRLDQNKQQDTAFGTHTLTGDTLASISFRQWPDGTVWAESGINALQITSNGTATELLRDRSNAFLYQSDFVNRYSLPLNDGTFALSTTQDGSVFRIGADGKPVETNFFLPLAYREDSQHVVGLWPSSRVLFYDPATNTLQGRAFDNTPVWTLPLGSKSLAPSSKGFHESRLEVIATPNADSSRFYLLAYDTAESTSARLFWIDQDGNTDLDSAPSYTLEIEPDTVTFLEDGQILITGRSQYLDSLGGPLTATQVLGTGSFANQVKTHSTPQPGIITKISTLSPDRSSFIAISGNRVNDVATGIVAKLTPYTTLDTSFVAELPPTLANKVNSIAPLQNGGVVVTGRGASQDELHVLDATGQSLFTATFPYGEKPPIAFPHGANGIVVVRNHPDQGTLVSRYLLTGQLDPNFRNDTPLWDESFRTAEADSQGRIYVLNFREAVIAPKLVRLLANGSPDPTFQFNSDIDPIHKMALNANGRPMVANNLEFLRIDQTGNVDPTFQISGNPYGGFEFLALANGNFLRGNIVFGPTGALVDSIPDATPYQTKRVIHENKFVTVENDEQTGISTISGLADAGQIQITAQPRSQTQTLGSPTTFGIDATGPGLTYQWHRDGDPIPGATSSRYSIPALEANDAGNYAVSIIWSDGQIDLPAFALTLQASSGQPRPKLDYLFIENWLELSWLTNPDSPSQLMTSSDLLFWQLAPYDHTSDGDYTRALTPLQSSTSPIFLRLAPTTE